MNRRELLSGIGLSGLSLLPSIEDKLNVEQFSEQKTPLYIYSNLESLLRAYPIESIKEIVISSIQNELFIKFDPNLKCNNKLDAFAHSIQFPITNPEMCKLILDIRRSIYVSVIYRTIICSWYPSFNIELFVDKNLPSQFEIYGWTHVQSTYEV